MAQFSLFGIPMGTSAPAVNVNGEQQSEGGLFGSRQQEEPRGLFDGCQRPEMPQTSFFGTANPFDFAQKKKAHNKLPKGFAQGDACDFAGMCNQTNIDGPMVNYKTEDLLNRIKWLYPEVTIQSDQFMESHSSDVNKSRAIADAIKVLFPRSQHTNKIAMYLNNNNGTISRPSVHVNKLLSSIRKLIDEQMCNGNVVGVKKLLEINNW